MSELDLLDTRVRSREAELDRAREALEAARQELDVERARVHAAVVALARQRNRRKRAFALGVLFLVAGAGLSTAAILTHVGEETFEGAVTDVRGPAPAQLGERCRVAIGPLYGPANASLEIDCAGQRLYGYGPFGAVRCETEGGRATLCTDEWPIEEDGDPAVRFDARSRTLQIHDGASWRVSIALDE